MARMLPGAAQLVKLGSHCRHRNLANISRPDEVLYHRIHPNTYIYFPATLGGYLETRFRHRAAPRRAVVPCATVNKENTLVRLQHRGAIREYKGE